MPRRVLGATLLLGTVLGLTGPATSALACTLDTCPGTSVACALLGGCPPRVPTSCYDGPEVKICPPPDARA